MILRTQKDAAALAVEMEKRAIRIYERALLLPLDASARKAILEILAQEKHHLERFSGLYDFFSCQPGRDRMLVQSAAAEVLFPGGVMEMQRAEALTDCASVYTFAADSEREAVARYTTLADRCPDPDTAAVFRQIANEEGAHLCQLEEKR